MASLYPRLDGCPSVAIHRLPARSNVTLAGLAIGLTSSLG